MEDRGERNVCEPLDWRIPQPLSDHNKIKLAILYIPWTKKIIVQCTMY